MSDCEHDQVVISKVQLATPVQSDEAAVLPCGNTRIEVPRENRTLTVLAEDRRNG